MVREFEALTILGWLSGCFPASCPLTRKVSSYKFRWVSISFLYWICSFSYMIALAVDFIWNNGAIYFDSVETVSGKTRRLLTVEIMSWVTWFGYLGSAVVIRLNSLMYIRETISMLQNIHLIEALQSEMLVKAKKISGVVPMIDYEKNWGRRSYLVWFGLEIILGYHVTHLNIEFGKFLTIKSYRSTLFSHVNRQVVVVLYLLSESCQQLPLRFATWLFVVGGIKLQRLYGQFGNLLEQYWKSPRQNLLLSGNDQLQLAEMFGHIQDLLNSFNSICGFNFLAIVVVNTMLLVSTLYGVQVEGQAFELTGFVGHCLVLLFICGFGYTWETHIQNTKDRVERCKIFRNASYNDKPFSYDEVPPQLTEVTQWFLNWQWSFCPKGVFPLNNTLMPMIVSSVMTYIIVIFQLKATEGSA
ncbi:unnamed protein product [Allacma fusca]|uniref:Uncharacterized protein n=1 Tax=Allacma fusca TaxID=39272 RepID=A0A8J2K4H1_9HEXA|nr:unnamed protein product [Allacma fusca]